MSQLDHTIRILKAYLSTNKVPRAELPIFMENVHKAVVELDGLPDDAIYETLVTNGGFFDNDLDDDDDLMSRDTAMPLNLAERRAQLGLDKAW
ncbi:MAG: hypothetical protein HQL53_00335 [Magnetococcales bacterium]|nr:hypothetical protein [Magnetococcales bacterium]